MCCGAIVLLEKAEPNATIVRRKNQPPLENKRMTKEDRNNLLVDKYIDFDSMEQGFHGSMELMADAYNILHIG